MRGGIFAQHATCSSNTEGTRNMSVEDVCSLNSAVLEAPAPKPKVTPQRGEPLWLEHMIAGCCELAVGVWLMVTLLLVFADWATKLLLR